MNNTLSSLGKLNWGDLIKTIVITIVALVINWLLVQIVNVHFVSDPATNQGIIGTISFILSYISKQLATDKQGNILGIGSK